MTDLSRRTILRAGAGVAVAVPMTVIAGPAAGAHVPGQSPVDAGSTALSAVSTDGGHQPVMFCVHDTSTGEVSILHGTREVTVRDRDLVSRILYAAASVPQSSVTASAATPV